MEANETKKYNDSSIKNFLENAPLYSFQKFEKSRNHSTLLIREIDGFCEKCDQVRPFHNMANLASGGGAPSRARGGATVFRTPALKVTSRTEHLKFKCVSCNQSKREFLVEQFVDGDIIKLQKCGEIPRKKFIRDPVVKRFLQSDYDNYEKAHVCLSHGYGVGAFAYFRRVLENNIIQLLNLVEKDVVSSCADPKIITALDNLKGPSPMSEKIKIANSALPDYLKPDGLNPLGSLYKVLSGGIHRLSEEECLEKAKDTSCCLEYLVTELNARRKNRDKFKSIISKL